MSKKKRTRRDIEKFYRMGRFWDLLRLLENEGLVSANAREHQESWKAVIRQALQGEHAFAQFCQEVGTLKSLPNNPDLQFLMRLKGFLEGVGSADQVLELTGLTPEAQRLRSNFAAFDASTLHQKKLGGLLAKFIREPDKITRGTFEQVVDLLPETSLMATVSRMGEYISVARRCNQKVAVARGWDGIDMTLLERMDRRLQQFSRSLPPGIRDVLLHPFVHNLAVMCRRLAPEAGSSRAAQLVRAIPFLLPRLAGEKLPEVESKLMIHQGEWVEGSVDDLKALQRKVEGLTIEGKVALLNGLRIRVQDRPSKEPDFDDLDYFYEDDEDGGFGFPEVGESDAEDLASALLLLHLSILKEISGRLPGLSLRERKELVRVMEPILLQDVDYILDATECTDEFLDLLDAAISAGCAGTRMGLLAILAGAHYRKNDLRKRAAKHLDQWTAPTLEDMDWLAKEWSDFFYPTARSLKPLLVRYGKEKALLAAFAAQLNSMAEFDMVESVLTSELSRLSGIPSALAKMVGLVKPKDFRILRRELDALAEFEVLDPLRQFLRCYPDDRLTVDGNLCWLNAIHSLRPVEVWGYALAELRRYGKMDAAGEAYLPVTPFGPLYKDKAEAVLLFVAEHHDELATLPTDTFGPLLDELLDYPKIVLAHHTLLIRLEKLLAERVEAGERTARPLMDRIRQSLQKAAGRGTKARKGRKGKR